MSAALTLAGAAAGIGAGALGLRGLLHLAILHGLRAPREPHERPIESFLLPGGRVERLTVHTEGGRRLAAWLATPDMPAMHPAQGCPASARFPLVATLHGWGSNAAAMWPAVPALVEAGHAVLLFDARCHGDSDGEPFTSMPRFAEDLAAALRHVVQDPRIDPARIALLGHSVGAGAALLLASGSMPASLQPALPPIRAVLSLSAFAHPREMMQRFLAEHRVPYPVVGWYVLRHVQRVIGARFDDIAPVRSIARVRCPVLLVHGVQDATVPHADALRLRAAASRAELLSVTGDHDLREALAPHLPEMLRFLERALRAGPQG